MKKILILNGSPAGARGNCALLIKRIAKELSSPFKVEVIHLAKPKSKSLMTQKLKEAASFVFVTGTYWDSWGSPMQRFLEDMTKLESSPVFLGKPCAVFVLNHSVGGKGILSRLQGVLSTFGCLIPPMSGMVYSLVTDLAVKNTKSIFKDDFWTLEDIELVLSNFKIAMDIKADWKVWPVDQKNFRKTWL